MSKSPKIKKTFDYSDYINIFLLIKRCGGYTCMEENFSDLAYHYISIDNPKIANSPIFDITIPFSLFHSSVLLTEQQIIDLYLAIDTEFSGSDLGYCWDFAIWYDYYEGRCIRIGDYLYREKSNNDMKVEYWIKIYLKEFIEHDYVSFD